MARAQGDNTFDTMKRLQEVAWPAVWCVFEQQRVKNVVLGDTMLMTAGGSVAVKSLEELWTRSLSMMMPSHPQTPHKPAWQIANDRRG